MAVADAESTDDNGGGVLRFVPAMAFGVRAAALAGLVVTAGAAAIGLTGLFDSPDAIASWPTGSTCCPDDL